MTILTATISGSKGSSTIKNETLVKTTSVVCHNAFIMVDDYVLSKHCFCMPLQSDSCKYFE